MEETYRVVINSDGYYPQCAKCHYFDLKDIEEYCPQCGAKQDWSHIIKLRNGEKKSNGKV